VILQEKRTNYTYAGREVKRAGIIADVPMAMRKLWRTESRCVKVSMNLDSCEPLSYSDG